MEFTKEEMLDIVSSVESEYDNLIKSEKENEQALAKNEDAQTQEENSGEDLKKYEYTAEDMEKMYAEMDKAEAKDHYDAVKKIMAKNEMSKMEMEKKEKEDKEKEDKEKKDKEDKEKKDKEDMKKKEAASESDKVSKSEKEIDLETKIADLEVKNKELEDEKVVIMKKSEEDDVVKAEFNKFMKLLEGDEAAPSQKSITEMNYIAKNENDDSGKEKAGVKVEEMSKTEISEILTKKSADPATASKDRKAINAYILEDTDINEIKHLLQGE